MMRVGCGNPQAAWRPPLTLPRSVQAPLGAHRRAQKRVHAGSEEPEAIPLVPPYRPSVARRVPPERLRAATGVTI